MFLKILKYILIFLIFFGYLIAFLLLFDGRMLLSDWHLVSGCGRGYNRPLSLIPRQSHHQIQPMISRSSSQVSDDDGIIITINPWSLNRHHHLHFQLLWIAVGIFSITHLHFMQRPKPPFSYFPRIKKSLIIIFSNSLLRPNLFSSHKMCDDRTHSWKNAKTRLCYFPSWPSSFFASRRAKHALNTCAGKFSTSTDSVTCFFLAHCNIFWAHCNMNIVLLVEQVW